ncbi:hypothetical protein M911_12855 [Ectothiorhodospira haloalkaliphila]|uniref:Uncharacterized protein n=1 Tax=Ectothiorhodospira haloalkaliphila TaxID=421628 RepID=W8KSA2_9GAMM|nr:hypothetical protein M911_12855 [Ectothiorhodospira haloalkaliphila]
MNQAIQNGISQGGITDDVVPLVHGQLAGGDGGSSAVAVFQHLQEITAVFSIEFHEPPVVENQYIHFGQVGQKLCVLTIPLGDAQLPQQTG